jgi:hypothetical protein
LQIANRKSQIPMIVPQAFKTAKRRVGRKRDDAVATAPAAVVSVVSVATVEGEYQQALWTFSSAVIEADDISGLIVADAPAISVVEITAEGALRVLSSNDVSPGDLWEVTGGVVLTFAGGGTLVVPENGWVL